MPRTREELEGSRQTAALKAEARAQRYARILSLYRQGESTNDIARRVHMHADSVRKVLRDALTDTRNRA